MLKLGELGLRLGQRGLRLQAFCFRRLQAGAGLRRLRFELLGIDTGEDLADSNTCVSALSSPVAVTDTVSVPASMASVRYCAGGAPRDARSLSAPAASTASTSRATAQRPMRRARPARDIPSRACRSFMLGD